MSRIVATADPRTITEKQLLDFVRSAARQLGWRMYHTLNSIGSHAGFPDLVLVRKGRVVWAELKAPRGRLSDFQSAWLDDLRETTDAVYVWRPEHMDAIAHLMAGGGPHRDECPAGSTQPVCGDCGRWRP